MPIDISVSERSERKSFDADFVAGIDKAQDKVKGFIEEKLVNSVDFESDKTLILSELGVGGQQIGAFVFSPDDDPVLVAEQIVTAAVDDGSDIGKGVKKYCLTIENVKGRCGFALEYPERTADEVDEAPNERGITSQLMRHNERLAKQGADMFDMTLKSLRGQLAVAMQENAHLRNGHAEMWRLYSQMLDHQAERELVLRRETKSEDRKDKAIGMLEMLAPSLAGRFLGAKTPMPAAGGSASPSMAEEATYRFLTSISGEQFHKLMPLLQSVFSQEQQLAFANMFQLFQERFEREAAKQQTNGANGAASHAPTEAAPPAAS